MNGKKRVHTTLEEETWMYIERIEKNESMLKNEIIDSAISLMKEFCKKNNILPKEVKKFLAENGFGSNLGINLGEFTTKINSITYNVYNGHRNRIGFMTINFGNKGITISHKFSDPNDNVNMEKVLNNLFPKLYHIFPQGESTSKKGEEKEKLPLLQSSEKLNKQADLKIVPEEELSQIFVNSNFNDSKLTEIKKTRREIIKKFLNEKGEMSQREIAELLGCGIKNTHRIIKKMERYGEIVIGPDTKEKSVIIRLVAEKKLVEKQIITSVIGVAEEIKNEPQIKLSTEGSAVIDDTGKKKSEEKPENALFDAITPELKNPEDKIGKTAEAPILKTKPRDASPAEIAMKIDLMKKTALSFPNAPINGSQIINQSAPILMDVLLNDFSAESLRVFAEKYKSSGNYDELVAYIATSLPSVLKTQEEEKEKIQPKKINTTFGTEVSKLLSSEKKIKNALEINGPLNRKQISEKTGISQPNLTGSIQKMKEAKIVSIDAEKWPQIVSLIAVEKEVVR